MLLHYISEQVETILRNQPPRSKRALWRIAAFTLLMGFMELGVAGIVSLLGVVLTAPQAVLALSPVQALLSAMPALEAIAREPALLLAVTLACVVVGVCLKNLLLGLLTYQQNLYSQALSASFGTLLFRSYMSKPYTWHLEQNAGELALILEFRVHVATFLISFFTLTTQGIIVLFLLAGGLFLAPLPTLLVFGITGATGAVTYLFSRRRIQRYTESIIAARVSASKLIIAGCQGIRDVQTYRRGEALSGMVDEKLSSIVTDTARASTLPTVPMWTLESVGMFSLLLALGAMVAADASLAKITGTLTLLAAMAWRLLPSVNKTINAIVTIQGLRGYLNRFFPALEEGKNSLAEIESARGPVFERSIKLVNISFRYPMATRGALHGITMEVPKGHMVGVVGASGAGKTTLIGILTSLLRPDSGHIEADGFILKGCEADLRSLIGYVPQSPYLLDATLAENVAFSRLGEPVDEERVLHACKMAAFDFLEQLPQGIHTMLGERGVKLSGGQAQRVAIARALYSEPQLLIFDEATSALDSVTESAIQQTVADLRGNITMVVIAHRLSTLKNCDSVYLLENGAVVDCGPPERILPRMQGREERDMQ